MRQARRVVLIGFDNFQGRETLKGIRQYWQQHGACEFFMQASMGAIEVRIDLLTASISRWKPDAIIGFFRDQRLHDLVLKSRLPAVNLSAALHSKLPQVYIDNREIGRLVAQHFLDKGLRNFGYCSRNQQVFTQDRCAAFSRTVHAAGFECNVLNDNMPSGKSSDYLEYTTRLERWLASIKKPVGVMASYDYQGTEVIWTAQMAGFNVPRDVAVAAVDNDAQICEFWTPALSSVDMGAMRCGYEAMTLLNRIVNRRRLPRRPVILAPLRVVTRQSSDVLAIEDADVAEAVRFIREHADRPVTVKDVLRHVPLSRRSLERRFSEVVGHSPRTEINRIRFDRAIKLLIETELPIPKVASNSGFLRHANFSAFFKRLAGMPPLAYRKRMRT